jgi:hypothetical protein
MSHPPVQRFRRRRLLCALLVGLITAGGSQASAQLAKRLDKKVRQYLSIDQLPERTRSLILSAIEHYGNGEHQQSLKALETILTDKGLYEPRRALRAWSNQWLALNYFALDSSVAATKKYVKLSIEQDVEIWREYAYSGMPQDLREIYQEHWDELQENFNNKRHSWRLAVGTISRVDYSYRSRFLEILAGIGAPVVVESQEFKIKQVLLYTRLLRMRRSIERITAGLYIEPSFLAGKDTTDNKSQFTGAISAGVVVAYPNKSGWEFGGSIEAVRLLFEKSVELTFSQTKEVGNSTLSYGNFEIYVRKWF